MLRPQPNNYESDKAFKGVIENDLNQLTRVRLNTRIAKQGRNIFTIDHLC